MSVPESAQAGTARYGLLALFIVAVLGGGLLISYLVPPGPWYAGLNKPAFDPPNWLFGPVWSVLYVLIAWAGWRTWRRDRAGPSLKLWIAQMGLNFVWPPIFFGAHRLGAGLFVIASLLLVISASSRGPGSATGPPPGLSFPMPPGWASRVFSTPRCGG